MVSKGDQASFWPIRVMWQDSEAALDEIHHGLMSVQRPCTENISRCETEICLIPRRRIRIPLDIHVIDALNSSVTRTSDWNSRE